MPRREKVEYGRGGMKRGREREIKKKGECKKKKKIQREKREKRCER